MPRKTRQQKMAAKLRRMKNRFEHSKPEKQATDSKPQESPNPSTYRLSDLEITESAKTPDGTVKSINSSYNYITADVRKILLLSVLAVAIEIVLSLTINSQFAKLLLSRFGIEI